MNKTAIIIIILVFSTGYFLMRTFSPSAPVTNPVKPEDSEITDQALPYGTALDFSMLHDYYQGTKPFDYPKVSPDQVGLPIGSLLKPQEAPKP